MGSQWGALMGFRGGFLVGRLGGIPSWGSQVILVGAPRPYSPGGTFSDSQVCWGYQGKLLVDCSGAPKVLKAPLGA